MRSLRLIVLSLLLSLGSAFAATTSNEWTLLKGCALKPNASNDGDSFHVVSGGREFIIRLYFVDAPETDARFPDRVEAQAQYFGITSQQALQVGMQAERFTVNLLSKGFSIITRFQDAMGDSRLGREYGFVFVNGQDLGELLVGQGLARIHGLPVKGLGEREQRLHRLEETAKAQRRGAWGLAAAPPRAQSHQATAAASGTRR